MAVNSREKGKAGEREWAEVCREHGFDARRGQQFCGSNGDADVVGLPHIHVEVKRVEQLNVFNAMKQSVDDARPGEIPIVAHRKNRKPWLVTMRAEDFFRIYEGSDVSVED